MTQGTVLVLCRANRCRSPLFEVMLRSELARRDVDVRVSSAGFLHAGAPADPASVAEASRRGLDLTAHRSHRVEVADLQEATLVLTMGWEQLRDAVALDPTCWPRTHTVRGLLGQAGARSSQEVGLLERVADWQRGRRASDLLRAGAVLDVPDPVGGPRKGFTTMARSFDELVPRVVDAFERGSGPAPVSGRGPVS